MTNESRLVRQRHHLVVECCGTAEQCPFEELCLNCLAIQTMADVRDSLQAKLAAAPAAEAGWQPIETAPTTSKAILVWVPENKCTFAVRWIDERNYSGKAGWAIFGGDWREHLQRATHWMPLPSPPGQTPPTPEAERLAVEIADEAAWELILSESGWETIDGVQWRDCSPVEGEPSLEKEIRYLGMRGLIIHHPDRPELVRVGEKP